MAAVKERKVKEVSKKREGVNLQAFVDMGDKFALINKYKDEGKEVPSELTQNFVTFPLSDDPFSQL